VIETTSKMLFGVMRMISLRRRWAPGAAIAFTIGKFGLRSLLPLGTLILLFYATCAAFVLIVLGSIARMAGFNILLLLRTSRASSCWSWRPAPRSRR